MLFKFDDRANSANTTRVLYTAELQAEQSLNADQANNIIAKAVNATAAKLNVSVSDVNTKSMLLAEFQSVSIL